jgi:transposase InsO family protein
MPWRETDAMTERLEFVYDAQRGLYTMRELCARYGIVRSTGYKWLDRFDAEGRRGLEDRSRAPRSCPHQMPTAVQGELLALKRAHPSWGPRKLRDILREREPQVLWPAASTIGALFQRHGLVRKRRRRRPSQHPGVVPPTTRAPNDLWTADFKGHFRTGDGIYCYPLTLADQHTRFLLACQGLGRIEGKGARAVLTAVFREYGLPQAIRTDNGVPFATTALHGLSKLNVWWMQLGIQHQRIRPGAPQENGAHERMHRTLKAETLRPPRYTRRAQQLAFNRFRQEYNEDRPHEHLRGKPPARVYRPSPRPYPERLPSIDYPGHYLVKRVTNAGTIRFKRKLLFLAKPLMQLPVGLEEIDDGVWSLYFNRVLLARFDEREYILHG